MAAINWESPEMRKDSSLLLARINNQSVSYFNYIPIYKLKNPSNEKNFAAKKHLVSHLVSHFISHFISQFSILYLMHFHFNKIQKLFNHTSLTFQPMPFPL